jgi:uncharacterized damage-inducible protein DinB
MPMTNLEEREVWLRGPLPGLSPALQPVGHALMQASEEVDRMLQGVIREELWTQPGGGASIGFHVLHMIGSLDRLLTYARGEQLSQEQRLALREESRPDLSATPATLRQLAGTAIDRALSQLQSTPEEILDDARAVGRAGYPSTVRGLLYHAGEHTVRHVGQAITTAKVVAGLRGQGDP